MTTASPRSLQIPHSMLCPGVSLVPGLRRHLLCGCLLRRGAYVCLGGPAATGAMGEPETGGGEDGVGRNPGPHRGWIDAANPRGCVRQPDVGPRRPAALCGPRGWAHGSSGCGRRRRGVGASHGPGRRLAWTPCWRALLAAAYGVRRSGDQDESMLQPARNQTPAQLGTAVPLHHTAPER